MMYMLLNKTEDAFRLAVLSLFYAALFQSFWITARLSKLLKLQC